ncbi:uncharacterized protein LOC134831160 isoform X2 [Culicoides brevitarsis]|uniref:uncharacterized protein LOC134831160 isoform X2 n=1 Tax=Culicoides brevitarsis TaxID=469753 RepID=UPI00307C3CE4
MNSASKVGEIFTAAGNAFNQLGNLTAQLQAQDSLSGAQIRQTLKKKAFEDAGLPVPKQQQQVLKSPTSTTTTQVTKELKSPQQDQMLAQHQQEITLNRLNADVDNFDSAVKMEFEAGPEEVVG